MALIDRGRVMIDYLDNLGKKDSYKAKFEALCKAIDEAPIVDAVPVVRCKDCKHRYSSEFCECRPENEFCFDGERNE